MVTTGTAPDAYAALRIPNFRRYIAALFTLTLALQIQGTVVGWQVYDLTRDPLALGLVGLAEALPAISISLISGHVADTHDRRRIGRLARDVTDERKRTLRDANVVHREMPSLRRHLLHRLTPHLAAGHSVDRVGAAR